MADKTNDVLLACTVGDVSWLRRGLWESTDLYSTDMEGFTGLHIAAKAGHYECLKHLFQYGDVDVNYAAKKQGLTPLHCSLLAKNKNSLKCVKFLLCQGAEVCRKDGHGSTALHYAAKTGQIKCIELLLENGADVHEKDNDNKMAYDVAQLNNQHRCFRFLTSVHWARKKDDMDLKQCKKETVVKKAKLRNEKLCLQLKQGRGAKAFSKWLSDKAIASVKTEPMECEERKRTRLASASLSACTYCSTIAASRGQSASSSSLKITPIKITPHQESRNLDFIGKPVKMLPYANYVKKSLHSKKPTASRHSKVGSKVSVSKIISRKSLSAGKISQRGAVKQVNGECAKGPGCSGSNDPLVEHGNTAMLRKMSSKSSRSEDNLLARHMFGPDQVAAASIGNKPMDINKNTNFLEDRLGVICKKGKGFKKEYHNCGGDDNGNSGMDDTDDDDYDDNDSDSDYNEGDCDSNEADDERDKDVDSESDDDDDNDDVSIRFYSEEPDNNDSLSCLQFNFNAEDENSFFHDVGPMNDLNSLALPPVLTKGRTPAEVLQIIRRLEHSSNNQGKQKTRRRSFSVSGSAGRSRHLNRRFSLGSIPEGEILYNYGNGYEASDDDDKVDSMVLLNLESIIGSISGRQEEKEEKERSEHLEDVEEKHQAQRESRLAETNGGTSDMAQGVPEQLSMESGNTPSCFTDKDSPRPSLSTLKIVNLEWDAATNSVHSDVSLSPLTTAPLHRRSSSSSTLSPADTGESNPGTPERRITPPSIKMTNRMIASAPPTGTVVRKTTPLSRKISPPILSNAEVTLLTKTIQEMQVEMASKKSDVDHKRKKTVHSEEKITSSAKMKAFSSGSDRGNETSTSSLSSPFAVSFSDPCMKLPSSIDWETKSMSPDQVQKTSFYIGDSDSSSSEDGEPSQIHSLFYMGMSPLASKSQVMSSSEDIKSYNSPSYSAPVIFDPLQSKSMTMRSGEDSGEVMHLSSSLPATITDIATARTGQNSK